MQHSSIGQIYKSYETKKEIIAVCQQSSKKLNLRQNIWKYYQQISMTLIIEERKYSSNVTNKKWDGF